MGDVVKSSTKAGGDTSHSTPSKHNSNNSKRRGKKNSSSRTLCQTNSFSLSSTVTSDSFDDDNIPSSHDDCDLDEDEIVGVSSPTTTRHKKRKQPNDKSVRGV